MRGCLECFVDRSIRVTMVTIGTHVYTEKGCSRLRRVIKDVSAGYSVWGNTRESISRSVIGWRAGCPRPAWRPEPRPVDNSGVARLRMFYLYVTVCAYLDNTRAGNRWTEPLPVPTTLYDHLSTTADTRPRRPQDQRQRALPEVRVFYADLSCRPRGSRTPSTSNPAKPVLSFFGHEQLHVLVPFLVALSGAYSVCPRYACKSTDVLR